MPFSRREFLNRLCAGGVSLAMAVPRENDPIGQIEMIAPLDGGTPRDPRRIARLGPREFRILALDEEGDSVLSHAVSRIDLLARNPGSEAEITLHLDLSG